MLEYAKREGAIKRPTPMLVSSMFGDRILFLTDFLKYYMEIGLEVTEVFQAIECKVKFNKTLLSEQIFIVMCIVLMYRWLSVGWSLARR